MANFISKSFDTYNSFNPREKILAKIGAVALTLCSFGMAETAMNNYHGTGNISCFGSASLPIEQDVTLDQIIVEQSQILKVPAKDLEPIIISENDNNIAFSKSEGLHFINTSGNYEVPTSCNN
jgi:hypothetical protein